MSFLPLVERELRVVSRRKSTFWIRCGAALLGALFLLPALSSASLGNGKSQAGAFVFWWMSRYGVVGCALAGAFLGADCIAEERRDGTLGFLFLTDLRPYDIVLGKFMGASLSAFYGVLAMAPLLSVTVLAGGVTGGEFWRTTLALLNMLFFSTALAVLISARVKSESRPTMLALGLMIAIWIGAAAAFEFSTLFSGHAASQILFWLSMASPGQAFSLASAANYLYRHADFWRSLAISNVAAWTFLGAACWRLDASMDNRQKTFFRARKPRNRKLLEVSPIVWLLDDSRSVKIVIWIVACGGVLAVALCIWTGAGLLVAYILLPFYLLLKIRFAVCACRFFAEGRRSGALELLRTTPLGGSAMISEQWKALRRIFLVPVCLLLAAEIVAGLWASGTREPSGVGSTAYILYEAAAQTADFFTIGYVGMWIALVCRKPNRAVWLTVLFLVLLPTILWCIPDFLVDAILIPIASEKVTRHLTNYLAVGGNETRDNRAMVRS
jgi:ABC-type transport system involved in multi-copper enzyme maturation permease subunit